MKSKEKVVDILASESLLKEIEALRLQAETLTKANNEKDKEINSLTAANELLKEQQAADQKTIADQKQKIKDLYASLAKKYRRTSEVYNNPDQLTFDFINDLEFETTNDALNDEEAPDSEKEEPNLGTRVKAYVRRKSKNAMLVLPADTPISHKYVESEPGKCSACGATMIEDGERVVDTITKTVTYTILRKHYKTYKCPNCEGNEKDREGVKGGELLSGTIADPSFISDIVVNKFDMGSTLYRIERELGYRGMEIKRQTISSWLMKCGNAMLGNLDEVLKQQIFKYPLINVDETPTKVLNLLDENGKKKAPNSKYNAFMVSITGIDDDGKRGLTMLIFTDNRRNETIKALLEGYTGCVQTDGLEGYNYASDQDKFTHLGCLVHARRKAVEAACGRKSGIAVTMVEKYKKIFHVESQWNKKRGTMSKEEFVTGRKAEMLPLFEDLKTYCEGKLKASKEVGIALEPKTAVAVNYYVDRYDELIRFLDYYCATSSNQTAEQEIRKYIINRQSSLFNITECGADVSALYFSLVQSCRNLSVNPIDYFTHLFLNAGGIKNGDAEGWEKILPGRCDLADAIKHKEIIASAKPDPNRTEPYILRGKKI